MVLHTIWRSKISAATSSGCSAKILALHFPHLASMAGRDGGKRLIVPHLLQATRFSAMLLFSVTCHTSLHPARLTAPHRMLFRAGALALVVARRIQSPRLSSSIWTRPNIYCIDRLIIIHRAMFDLGLRRSLPLELSGICSCCERENRRALRLNEDALYIGESCLNTPLQFGDVVLHLG